MSDPPRDLESLPTEIADLYERFVGSMRAGDLQAASRLAPSISLTAGEAGQETGPLHPQAFQTDEAHHRLLAWYPRAEGRVLLRSGAGWFVVAPGGDGYEIVDAGLKPID
ncbi:hypothetical protein FHU33_2318 [Blastococcus colisei]|uniref:SnoaL-like protein n=1 Tax=Blastococcus colisei TaxID=1564162 RepID=A0A543PFR2_9ACTN|nr:hypothetical protein [Blastococcus colisei]TQN42907.1 hypothetical protein FHU33_2318 [Blastococcus colisei]